MLAVDVTGWKPGLKSVSFIKLIRQQGTEPHDLAEAKLLVDRLLEGKGFSVNFATESEAATFIKQADELGAVAQRRDLKMQCTD